MPIAIMPLSTSLTRRCTLVTASRALSDKSVTAVRISGSRTISKAGYTSTTASFAAQSSSSSDNVDRDRGNGHDGRAVPTSLPERIDARWLASINHRIGKCLAFGATPAQARRGGEIAKQLALNWRELVAGSEGYVTAPGMRSLFKHPVVWGEMVGSIIRPRPGESAIMSCHVMQLR
ncbi:hypothetical protein AAP_04516 [Ascosphaera apis ARSEF 7405]|uniref:Uncharacterized protein n=1 Tax=Ascosphaera apis ARSEF 7405 TaxID=392613 RepID=A0A167WM55_9EURO|nr:hypothetical protein AAP_04516 [Ascosphaera apis ARSEF 7405]